MATSKHGKYIRNYFDQYRVSNWVSSGSADFARDGVEYTPLEDEFKLFLPGKTGGTSALNGFLDIADDGFDELNFADITAPGTHYVCRTFFAGTSQAQGDIVYETQEFNTGDGRAYDQAGIAMLNWSGQVTGGVVRGVVLLPETAATSVAFVGTALNYGASVSGERFVYTIRCVSVTGTGSVTVQLWESSDNAGDAYAAVSGLTATFTSTSSVLTSAGVFRTTTTAATEAYKKVKLTALSGITSATFHVTIGVEAASDIP